MTFLWGLASLTVQETGQPLQQKLSVIRIAHQDMGSIERS